MFVRYFKLTRNFYQLINPFKYFVSQYGNDRSSFFTKQSRLSFKGNAFKSKFEIDEVKHLFYYKNSNLFVTNTVVSPLYLESVDDSSANFPIFNWRKYYSVCNNGDSVKKLTTVQKQKLIDFGNVFEFYNFKYDDVNDSMGFKVFTKSNPNISHNLFEDIFKKNITVVDAKNNIIPISKIFTVNNPAYEIKSFDKKGNVNGSKFIGNEVNVDSFYIFCINQHYYFDTLKNILISEVNYLDFYRKIVTNAGIDLGLGFFYRIYFMKPSQYKKSNRKGFLNDF